MVIFVLVLALSVLLEDVDALRMRRLRPDRPRRPGTTIRPRPVPIGPVPKGPEPIRPSIKCVFRLQHKRYCNLH